MENKPKYFRLLEEGETLKDGDIHVRDEQHKQWIEETEGQGLDIIKGDDVYFRPITLPQVGWPPGKEWEELRKDLNEGRVDCLICDLTDGISYYLPPLTVLDGVKEEKSKTESVLMGELSAAKSAYRGLEAENHNLSQEIFDINEELDAYGADGCTRASTLTQRIKNLNNALCARISELEESLRKAEADVKGLEAFISGISEQQSPTWQELETFEGKTVGVAYELGKWTSLTRFEVKIALGAYKHVYLDQGWTHVRALNVPMQKPDNSARIAELERELQRVYRNVESFCVASDQWWSFVHDAENIQAELAKLKEANVQ